MSFSWKRFRNFRRSPKALDIHAQKMLKEKWTGHHVHLLHYRVHMKNENRDHVERSHLGFVETISKAFGSGEDLRIVIDNEFPFDDVDFSKIKGRIVRLDIGGSAERTISISNTDIRDIIVHGSARHNLILKNCHVGEIKIDEDRSVYFDFANSWISNLALKKASVRHWDMSGGGLLSIVVKSDDSENPFTGPVVLRDVYLPREDTSNLTSQRLRDVRAHLLKRNNTLAAGTFHSAELALERDLDSWPNCLFSWLYEVMADFGNSTSRPLKALLLSLIFMASLCFIGDAIKEPEKSEAIGWKEALVGPSAEAKLLRSVTYSISTFFNPVGILQSKPILVSKSPYWTASLAAIGLSGTLSIVFLIIAIRRRFKLE